MISWPADVGSGSIIRQGSGLSTSLINGINAIHVNPSSTADATQYLQLGLGRSFLTTDGFTLMMLVQDYGVPGASINTCRVVSLLDNTTDTATDNGESTSCAIMYRPAGSNNHKTFFDNSEFLWENNLSVNAPAGVPTLLMFKYSVSQNRLFSHKNSELSKNVL